MRIGNKVTDEESVSIAGRSYARKGDGNWMKDATVSYPRVVRPDPANSPFERKPNSSERLYFSLGTMLYKGQVLSVYENVTRHTLIKKADRSEVYYEDRYKTWLAPGKTVVRADRTYVIIHDGKTSRSINSTEWERNAIIEPLKVPAN
jgi:hypothetical protein